MLVRQPAPVASSAGLHVHVGSQILTREVRSLEAARDDGLADEVRTAPRSGGTRSVCLNLGGGFGVGYRGERVGSDLEGLGRDLVGASVSRNWPSSGYLFEPGRFLVAEAGVPA